MSKQVNTSAKRTSRPVAKSTPLRDANGRFLPKVSNSKTVTVKAAKPVQASNDLAKSIKSSFITSMVVKDGFVRVKMKANPAVVHVFKPNKTVLNKILNTKSLGEAYNSYLKPNRLYQEVWD